jgi:omega-6 fatty acid desaturase (delta-12 desaturase)
MLRKADFILTPYIKSSDLRGAYQVGNTLIPYALLWVIAGHAPAIAPWLIPPVLVLLVLLSLRCFCLMHDCGHNSLFRSKWANRFIGFVLGVINAIPQYGWSRDHAYHHKTNGDWERYRGVADFLSTREFAQLKPWQQSVYELLRHPLMAIPGGFFYLAIKPRLTLMLGVYDFTCWIFRNRNQDLHLSAWSKISTYQSQYWQSATEFWDLLLNNLCVIASWVALSHLWGAARFWSLYTPVMSCSATIFIWVFFVQHIFEGTYAHTTAGWDYVSGAVKGSSYLEFPAILRWFVADIGYHNVHHLSERIPNYHLAACHRANSSLLSEVKTLRLGDLMHCAQFLLWDEEAHCLITIASFRQKFGSVAPSTDTPGAP